MRTEHKAPALTPIISIWRMLKFSATYFKTPISQKKNTPPPAIPRTGAPEAPGTFEVVPFDTDETSGAVCHQGRRLESVFRD